MNAEELRDLREDLLAMLVEAAKLEDDVLRRYFVGVLEKWIFKLKVES